MEVAGSSSIRADPYFYARNILNESENIRSTSRSIFQAMAKKDRKDISESVK